MGKLPDRWLPYSSVGQPIEGTKFIAFKVPLKEAICRNLKPDERFTPSMLVEQCPRLSLVVDLTNTKRYYSPKEFLSRGILYQKIFCPGKVIPQGEYVKKFIDIVDDYVNQKGDSEESLIGVHCTHGLNRTAYFICTYMIKRLKIPAQEAISAFERARGHPIERQEYIKALIDGPDVRNKYTDQQHQTGTSPLDSLYEERPAHRSRYDPRRRPEHFNSDRRRNRIQGPCDGINSYLPRIPEHKVNRYNMVKGDRNHLEQRHSRYGNDREHFSRRSDNVSSRDSPSESHGCPSSRYLKRPRDRNQHNSSEEHVQQHKQKYGENSHFVRVGRGMDSGSHSGAHSHSTNYRPNSSKKGRYNSFSSKQSHDRSERDSHNSGNDSYSR